MGPPYYIALPDFDINDTYYNNLWGMDKILAPEAWDMATGNDSVKIGVLDTGFDYTHPDLDDNLDRNLAYYVAQDTYGYSSDIMDYNGHGTHVAGTIGAEGNNNVGVTGVNWDVTIAPIKIANSNSVSSSSMALMTKAMLYATELDLPITSMSYSVAYSTTLISAVRDYDGLFIKSAGNTSANNDNNSMFTDLHALGNVIFVANTTSADVLSGTSSYGLNTTALAAPGNSIYSTVPGGGYGYKSGTSMAAPHVAGAAALLLSYKPNLTTQELKDAILNNVDEIPALNGFVATGGRLNVYKALQSVKSSAALDSVFAAYNHSMVIQNGEVWTTGWNQDGQLGDGTQINRSLLHGVIGLDHVISVAAGGRHSLTLKSDGTVWSWGSSSFGQLGNGRYGHCLIPEQIQDLTDVIAIATGYDASYAVKADGTAWVWGDSHLGHSTRPVQIDNLNRVKAISSTLYFGLALKTDGTVWGWGSKIYFLGHGAGGGTQTTPIRISGLNDIVSVSAGMRHSLALKSDGTVWAWGENSSGELGNNSSIDTYTPIQVPGLTDVVAVSAGSAFSLALKSDGTVWSWGQGVYNGVLGNGLNITRRVPGLVSNLSNVIAITAGEYHCLAIQADGSIWAWGSNGYGQLGNNTTTYSNVPVLVFP